MDTSVLITELPTELRVIPLRLVAEGLGVSEQTARRYCERFNVPMVKATRKTRGLLPHRYIELLQRMQGVAA